MSPDDDPAGPARPRRRTLLGVLCAGALAAFAANAQQEGARKAADPLAVGLVAMGPQTVFRDIPTYARFYARMRELGWREGENVRYVERGAAGDLAKLDSIMQELLRARVALVVTVGTQEALAAKRATGTIPIVMVHPSDPVEFGIVASYNRPGGNITGNLSTPFTLGGKRVELISEMLPYARRIVLGYDASSASPKLEAAIDEAARKRGLAIVRAELPAAGEYDAWAAKAKRDGAGAAIIAHSAGVFPPARRKALAEALVKHRLPAICGTSEYVASGCLASYGASNIEFFARAAVYADKILRGAKPGDLPIQQPTIYELVINGKTAKALGITIPQLVLLRADRVIE